MFPNQVARTVTPDLDITDNPVEHVEKGDYVFVVWTGRNHLVWDVDPKGRPRILASGGFTYLERAEYEVLS